MPRPHYYNDHDPKVCAWLRELIAQGLLPEGDVDERSITDVDVRDLAGYTACHFFAGIGGWPLALRLAGWPDDRPVWTGSPPCQPFSAAGQRRARGDDRHLAPAFLRLVRAGRPPVLFGEQVASSAVVGKAGGRARRGAAGPPEWAWLDDLSDGLEAAGYAVGAADLPAAGVGAPHIRQRLFFGAVRLDAGAAVAAGAGRRAERVAEPVRAGLEGHAGDGDCGAEPGRDDARPNGPTAAQGGAGGVGNAGREHDERQRGPGETPAAPRPAAGEAREQQRGGAAHRADSAPRRLADAERDGSASRGAGIVSASDREADDRGPAAIGRGIREGAAFGLGDPDDRRHRRRGEPGGGADLGEPGPQPARAGADRRLAEPDGVQRRRGRSDDGDHEQRLRAADEGAGLGCGGSVGGAGAAVGELDAGWPGAADEFWRDADWLLCRDGRWRPVRPGSFPLADGVPARVVRLRGYGNAIVPQVAAEFIVAFRCVVREAQR